MGCQPDNPIEHGIEESADSGVLLRLQQQFVRHQEARHDEEHLHHQRAVRHQHHIRCTTSLIRDIFIYFKDRSQA